MQIVIKADPQQKKAILAKGIPGGILITWLTNENITPLADAYFDLGFEDTGAVFNGIIDKPVFVNSVINTCAALPPNCIRMNGWNGFLERVVIEIAAPKNSQMLTKATRILLELNWQYEVVPDTPGMISARIIAMIVNEAYFGLDDEISTKKEIDIAMQLGTNYPYGPFEWSGRIGLHKIYALLKKLGEQDNRYAVAPTLEKEIAVINPINK